MLVENATSPWGQSWERVFQDCPHGEIRHFIRLYLVPLPPYTSHRDNLDLDKGFEMLSQRMGKKKTLSKNSEEFDVLVLEVIRLAMNSEVQISDAWFNAIDKGTLQPDQKLKSLDLLILFQLYDLPNKRKSVESLFKNKIRSGKVTEELVRNCFKVYKYFLYK